MDRSGRGCLDAAGSVDQRILTDCSNNPNRFRIKRKVSLFLFCLFSKNLP